MECYREGIGSVFPTPPPCSSTVSLSNISMSRLSKALSSGVMVRSFFASLLLDVTLPTEASVAEVLAMGLFGSSIGLRRRMLGSGKLFFLSIVSIIRRKRRNRLSARIKVDSRSIVPDRSLTRICQQTIQLKREDFPITIFQDLIKMFEVFHYHVSMLL